MTLRKVKCELCGGIANYADDHGPAFAERLCGCVEVYQKKCDHEFVDTSFCIKCGWKPARSNVKESHLKNPMQPVCLDRHGVVRFKPNAIVKYLLDHGSLDLNDIGRACAENGISQSDQEQFAQLIGYSVSGFGELSYVSKKTWRKAEQRAKKAYEAGVRVTVGLE